MTLKLEVLTLDFKSLPWLSTTDQETCTEIIMLLKFVYSDPEIDLKKREEIYKKTLGIIEKSNQRNTTSRVQVSMDFYERQLNE